VALSVVTPPLRFAVPSDVVPLKNSTVPVGVPVPGLTAATVAVNVTAVPAVTGLGTAVSDVVVLASLTITVVAGAMLAVKLVSPEYRAVMEFVPRGTTTLGKVATPALRSAVPSDVDPLKISTVPVGVFVSVGSAEVTIAWSVIGWPETIELAEAETVVWLAVWPVETTSLLTAPG
jgi:hypothetical protein